MGDNLPDFENMSEEETMRWLESLATRQGADTSEMTTSADMDVPEIDPETADMSNVGPGYVPSETFSRPLSKQKPPAPAVEPEKYDEEQEQPTEQVATYSAFDEQIAQLDETPVSFDSQASVGAPSTGTPDLEALAMDDPMAFLQALAARQGANPNEFVQAGSVDVPELDPETADMTNVGPGYVPSETFSFSSHAKPTETVSETPVEEVITPQEAETPEIYSQPADNAAAYQDYDQSQYAGTEATDQYYQQPTDDAAAYQGDDQSQYAGTEATDQYYQQPTDDAAAYQGYDQSQYAGTEATDQYYQQPTDDAAAYQGYDQSQYAGTEATDQYYQQPTDDAAAYQGYDQSQYADIGEMDQLTEATPSSELVDSELSAEIDPIAWLESLAARQGATEGFTTSHDLDVPEVDPETADMTNVGPGYTPYDTGATTGGKKAQADEPPQQPATVVETVETSEGESESLAWLEDLAADQGADVTSFLDELTTESEALPGFDLDFDASSEEATSTLASVVQQQEEMNILSGMSDEEIARAQADGTITPEQELAWLLQKAKELEELHEDEDVAYDPDAAAIPGEVPDWVRDHMPGEDELEQLEQLSAVVMPPFDDINLPEPEDIDWLSETTTDESVDLILEDTSQMESIDISPMVHASTEIVGESTGSGEFDPWAEDLDAEYEMRQQSEDQEPDWYAKAVEDVEREIATEISPDIPEIEQVEVPESEPSPVFSESSVPNWLQETDDDPIAGIEDVEELPDWLRSDVGDDSVVGDWLRKEQFGDSDTGEIDWLPPEEPIIEDTAAESVPDWLTAVADGGSASPVEPVIQTPIREPLVAAASVSTPSAPDGEELVQGVDGALPSWYSGTAPLATPQPVAAPAPPPVPAYSPPPPAPARTAPPPRQRVAVPHVQQPIPPASTPAVVPEGEHFAQYRQTLEQNPNDHETRLKLARELEKQGSVNASLEHYETLIESSAALDVVSTDLATVISRVPAHPKVRRLLGDTYMRQGRLQEALDTYRGALDQL
jgi:hypothetical protein